MSEFKKYIILDVGHKTQINNNFLFFAHLVLGE